MVAGFDLRNEVRPAHGVAAEWGNGGKTDFALACEKTGNMILEVKIGNKKIYAISNRICVCLSLCLFSAKNFVQGMF